MKYVDWEDGSTYSKGEEQEQPFSSREEQLETALKRMGDLVDRRGKELEETKARLEGEISRGIAVDAELDRQRQRVKRLEEELESVLRHDREAVQHLNAAEADLAEIQRQNTDLKASLQNWQRNYDTLANQYWEMCVCNRGPDTDGPEEDCPLHGREEYRPPALARRLRQVEEALSRIEADAIEQQKSTGTTQDHWKLGVYAQASRTRTIIRDALAAVESHEDAPIEDVRIMKVRVKGELPPLPPPEDLDAEKGTDHA